MTTAAPIQFPTQHLGTSWSVVERRAMAGEFNRCLFPYI
jgi:hypothetical protein